MSHEHYCDFTGHYWCVTGLLCAHSLATQNRRVCIWIRHRVPKEVGGQSECSIELIACPEHR